MNFKSNQIISFFSGLLWLLVLTNAVRAEDIELFVGNAANNSLARPNILLLLDDSGSMGATVVTQNNYDPSVAYPSSGCDVTRVYWSTSGRPPSCGTDRYFNLGALQCQRALDAFATALGGTYTDNMAQYDPGSQDRWETIASSQKTRMVECQDDRPDPSSAWLGHGDGSSLIEVYAQNGDDNNLWSNDPNDEISWGQVPADRVYTLYSGNYMNWYYGTATTSTRIQVMKDVATNLVNSVNGVNIGVMGFNTDEGGYVHHAIENVATGRTTLTSAINAMTATSWTPLSETLHEAHNYLRGGSVNYGTSSVSAARDPTDTSIYESPIDFECQKTHVVLLTDGEPTRDHSSTSAITSLTDSAGSTFNSLVGGACDVETYPTFLSPDTGHCLDDLAEFMHDGDFSPLTGQQGVTIHTVGFLIDLPVLAETAARGGGEYYTADNTATLNAALTSIITSILDTQATFTAPAVSINSFNRTRNLDDLFISVFKPSGTTHWPGNLKKYRLEASTATIVDANGNPAIDPSTGFFADTSQSFWSPSVDGSDIENGGAANMIPQPRNVYTFLGNQALTNSSNQVNLLNGSIDDALLNTGNAGDPTRTEVIAFINGLDASDVDQDSVLVEPRNQMGDPLHAQPVSVVYGPTANDANVYFATNDGYLHAIDAQTGIERWAFLPPEFIGNQVEYFKDNQSAVGSKFYGVDGSLRVQTIGDNDGIVEPGEKVMLFFGMRRGGDTYYALDISNRDQPTVMWSKDSSSLPGIGQSWSSATPTRINISGAAQNADKSVLVIGGGYDPSQDSPISSLDSNGNSIYIVDSQNGNLLWQGSKSGADEDFDSSSSNRDMDYSIPADIRVIDLNGDDFADRLYAADMGGQVWRFDIFNGQPKNNLVHGGVIAQLGSAGIVGPTIPETRRFYYAPDVALVSNDDYSFIHVGIGSGYRAHPNETTNQNRFYALRDYNTFNQLTQADFQAITPIVDGDLVDVTSDTSASVPQGAPGWKLELSDGGWIGEKVLAETRTFNNEVFVTTYRPGTIGNGCQPALGTNRQYVMSLFNGAPVNNLDGSADPTVLTEDDRYTEWLGAPPPETVFIFADDPACVGNSCSPVQCVDVNCGLTNFNPNPRRTFWTEESLE
jgi:type IV pilus assembly protein PilY1